ncbi:UDP-N-acetylmuramoyl-L-alanine--D-glutamate ligase [Azospirillum brasilense]|uniref:UDP-N-acetylmuramoylalanine--D-glutamate ligase n=1 Tax=Azospirillum brasilense TaxID=192 RepID=A0A0P0EL48_AZOBR|nr:MULTISPECIES: UDP-N-acetylmuramoyl-L-alanine--D-glutamate ligase [Azospirillum]ALJ34640.1 UDP-N-acetylmuramoylalanine--D-glutamate ligase [Azospirillum brasilense]MDW7553994.1 UDP-N-acetylmuramoyl-L-alanine--D-glutamate ligase [Azospirillum brasilense]MDW7593039.1 UDP-N-acetylmuramoyl-L-alanine--D-glutamate ligase [Azospirillum brasilense]MDW7593747.1 UDP-N-acetylmuramoyl-L-alanine--D-glutamate ligase [Azospirillum brasilense]MDW7627010.1 UDP-N-acetylmuramoyl-L-alanine--D-glutamate ligase [
MINLFYMEGLPVAVMGLGKSGLATAEALTQSGAEVWVWDDNESSRADALSKGYKVVDLTTADLTELTTIVWSPGIPHTHPKPHPVALRARAANIELVCDIELLARSERDSAYIGITGTNGKSTTTTLIGHVMEAAGRRIAVGGNLGTPALTFPSVGAGGSYVLEMSSYQLELTYSITFDVAVLLNITPDHLARHGGMDGYVAAKKLIFHRQTRPRTAVIGVDDPTCRAIWEELKAKSDQVIWPVSALGPVAGGVYAADGWLVDDTFGVAERVAELAAFPALLGTHNWQNAAAAYAACKAAGVPTPAIVAAMTTFPGLAHRQQLVRTIDGVRFVNDSKATNADATEKALATFDPIYWILGGQAKETGLDGLEAYASRVRHAFLIGEASDRFAVWLEANKVPHTRCGTLDVAVNAAAELALAEALPGACVLLSPACASWDQFANFEKRGEAFADAVNRLEGNAVPGDRA